ncbi:ATP-binding protein [Prevotella sp. P6B4]|uniref:sensor histidine kinase n=1 Tax=Prevotella sp. P6B4 TaxID=1410614 RepID=UPI0009DCF261|nr:ATP-binding protein [Prevotella sp. P6B4]
MNTLIRRINRDLSLKLSLGIMLFLIVVFFLSLGVLFMRSRQLVRQEAIARAELELDNMTQRVDGLMNEVEASTYAAQWHLLEFIQPDSLLSYVRRIVTMNPNFDGCSIATVPDYFPQKGRYFSVYAYHKGDTVVAKVEDPYDYFDKSWYKTPATLGKDCWVEAYSEYIDGTVSQSYSDMIVSYCVPLYTNQKMVGVISTDLSMPWLSSVISEFKPYAHSYSIMLGADGQYFIHPDSTKVLRHSIFSDADVNTQQDIIALGHEMIAGKKGILNVKIDGQRCVVLYQPLKRAAWSIALVVYESDILAGYTKLIYILIPLLVFGLLVILAFCLNVMTHMVRPLRQLTEQLSYITHGHYNEPIDFSHRRDVIGRLQNNFAEMQLALYYHITNLQRVNEETEEMNRELKEASNLAREADERKNEFLLDIAHQIRTPLNIINGFTQVLRDDYESIPPEEIQDIIETMQNNAISISRMTNMLMVAANSEKGVKIKTNERVNIHDMVEEIAQIYASHPPHTVDLITDVRVLDTFTVKTNRDFLMKAINELLFNAKKFTTEGYVKLEVIVSGIKLAFVIEDTGPGISESDREKIFLSFSKLDVFGEGLGLGLPVCRRMVRMLGGDLKLDSEYVKGSRFFIVIPNDEGGGALR